MSDPAKSLRDRLDELSRPRLAKCPPPSRRERGESRAAQCFGGALEACGLSQRAAARWLSCDERLVRDWLHGARALPAWAMHALPREGQIAYLTLALQSLPDNDDDDTSERAA